MLKNNFWVLMAERSTKISVVSKETGLSRTTLTSLKYNRATRIDFNTLEILCKYLGITPGEFFDYKQQSDENK
ncbi:MULTISPECIES: helix-turn-helix transcriptional regulator [unclassified Lactococcus]|uniref:helix-turn-helix domain-containing protein n=1 Tax=unclassified Lactococcus TaxID=2643510 RepID=UPI0011C854C0|nr:MULTISPECIES: helix-turn-helix transcriptional regulator [unclassified Lactococcus]MQW23915.1 helix-turn-helix domain-containing protein [Lactococcus sp. dk101]TXK37141.1 helix-turn-helix transcriptional regulator [Lactococcus sp. dk310]TXK47995.1 helix-turn-helix transcriptional regulator [Lactococcus sp. dk322]